MPDMLAIAQGLNAVKALTDIAKTMIGLRDSTKILETSVELNSKIADVQIALNAALAEQTTLIQTIREREEEITCLKAWDGEKEKYELKDLGSGSLALVIKPDAQGSEPVHCLCVRCSQDGKKRIMQNTGEMAPAPYGRKWRCSDCGTTINIRVWPPGFELSPPAE
jgi:hypothetical protein